MCVRGGGGGGGGWGGGGGLVWEGEGRGAEIGWCVCIFVHITPLDNHTGSCLIVNTWRRCSKY